MCEPVTVLTTLSIASAAAGAIGQYQNASALVDASEEQAQNQAEEFAAQRDQQIGERVAQGRAERARLRVAAGEAGVSGNSFEAQIRQSLGDVNQDLAIAQKQSSFTGRSIQANLKSNTAGTRGVGGLNAGLQIAKGAVSGFETGLAIKQSRKNLGKS